MKFMEYKSDIIFWSGSEIRDSKPFKTNTKTIKVSFFDLWHIVKELIIIILINTNLWYELDKFNRLFRSITTSVYLIDCIG